MRQPQSLAMLRHPPQAVRPRNDAARAEMQAEFHAASFLACQSETRFWESKKDGASAAVQRSPHYQEGITNPRCPDQARATEMPGAPVPPLTGHGLNDQANSYTPSFAKSSRNWFSMM